MKTIRPPFKIHGGKRYLSKWIVEHFPKNYENLDYLEAFSGAASVFLNKKPSIGKEILNDLDPGVVSIQRTIRDECAAFVKKLKATKYSERVFLRELNKTEHSSDFDKAVNEFIIRRMSRGGMKKAFAWSDRERGGKPGDVNAWETIIDVLPLISSRLNNVFIFNKPAIQVINAFNYENMLLYADPPYDPDVRTSKEVYDIEMTVDQHEELFKALNNFKGKVIISGYYSPLYKRLYKGWNSAKKQVVNHSSQQKTKDKRLEMLWMNY